MQQSSVIESATVTVDVATDPTPDDRIAVRQFLSRQPGPTLPYDPSWCEILHNGLDHQSYYLIARQRGRVVGLLPLALVRSLLFGRYLVSLPYLNYAGPLSDDPTVIRALVDQAVRLADQLNVRYLELRNRIEVDHPLLTEKKSSKVLMWRELPTSAEALWGSFKPEVRNQIRKGDKHGLECVWGSLDLLDDFYHVFCINMRDLGTPVFGRRLFGSILAALDHRAEVCVVRLDNAPIASALLLHGSIATEVPSASSLREHNKTCANMWMYHHLLLRALERGQAVFDFGRSSEDSGTFRFKRQWGAVPQPSVWQYYRRIGDVSEVRPDNPKYQRRIEIWKRLPVWFTRLIGPTIVRGIP